MNKSNIAYPLLYLIGITLWYGITLQQSENLLSDCGNLWIYCLIAICIGWLNFLTHVLNNLYCKHNNDVTHHSAIIVTMIILAHFIWGCVIMGRFLNDDIDDEGVTKTCRNYYEENGGNLLFLFDFNYWFQVALICILFICICGLMCC